MSSWSGIAWPALQLVIAVGVIALLILALGWVAGMTGEETDILGFGLVGVRGLVRYFRRHRPRGRGRDWSCIDSARAGPWRAISRKA